MIQQIIGKIVAHKAGIALGAAAVGVVTTAILAAKDARNYDENIEQAEFEKDSALSDEEVEQMMKEQGIDDVSFIEYLNKKEKAIIFAKSYWRTGLSMTVTFALMIFSHVSMAKELAAAVAALGVMSTKYDELKNTLKEKFPDTYDKIEKLINERNIRSKLADENGNLIKEETYDGRQRYYDPWSKQVFFATEAEIKEAECTINESMANLGEASLYLYLSTFPKSSGLVLDESWMSHIGWFCGGHEQSTYEYNVGFFGAYIKPEISKESIVFNGDKIEVNVINWDNMPDYEPDMPCSQEISVGEKMNEWRSAHGTIKRPEMAKQFRRKAKKMREAMA